MNWKGEKRRRVAPRSSVLQSSLSSSSSHFSFQQNFILFFPPLLVRYFAVLYCEPPSPPHFHMKFHSLIPFRRLLFFFSFISDIFFKLQNERRWRTMRKMYKSRVELRKKKRNFWDQEKRRKYKKATSSILRINVEILFISFQVKVTPN